MSFRLSLFWSAPLVAACVCACATVPPTAVTSPRAEGGTFGPTIARSSREDRAADRVITENPCARRRSDRVPRPALPVRQSSPIALAVQDHLTLAYVADADRHAIHAIDVDRRAIVGTTPLEGAPSQIVVVADGRIVVALRDENRVAVLEPRNTPELPLDLLCESPTPSEPIALFVPEDERTLFVTSGWGRALSAYDSASLDLRFSVRLPREPRAVIVEPSGKRAFVSHAAAGALSIVHLDDPALSVSGVDLRVDFSDEPSRASDQGFALSAITKKNQSGEARFTRIFAPIVSVDQAAGNSAGETYGARFLAAAPLVAVVDAESEKLLSRRLPDVDGLSSFGGPSHACTLPRAAALVSDERLLVGCLGVDAVLELDARARDPMQFVIRRFAVPAGPTGLAVDREGERALVWSQFASTLTVLDMRNGSSTAPVAEIVVSKDLPPGMSEAEARGRILFHKTNDPRISGDGRACESCHVDGRDDGLTWNTPEGQHQTIMLAGRARGGAPFGWRGETLTLRHHVGRTLKRLAGRGMNSAEDFADLDALIAYLKFMPAPPRVEPDAARKSLVARGRELFDDPRQGCATCHPGGDTDRAAYDVARSPWHIPFDTPSLRFVGGTAPYFHDGRYATLGELLRGVDGAMGHTGALSDDDLHALEVYLEEL